MRVLQIDRFDLTNSNYYWLKYFQRAVGRNNVFPHDIRTGDVEERIKTIRPEHIHMGGSVKNFTVTIETLRRAYEIAPLRVTCYYGDATYSEYHEELARIIDKLFISNRSYVKTINEAVGRGNVFYMGPPTDPEVFKPYKVEKEYDVIFIGNKYGTTTERVKVIEEIRKKYNLAIYGARWEESKGQVYGEEFAKACSKAKIAIDILVRTYARGLHSYFSNRPLNTMAAGCFYIIPYTDTMEESFENGTHLVWYKTYDEMFALIEYYLKHDEEREKIAEQGREYVISKFTYEKFVKELLSE